MIKANLRFKIKIRSTFSQPPCVKKNYYQLRKFVSVKKILLLFIVICSFLEIRGQIIYVKSGATGNGSSWEDAAGDLQKALDFSKPGNQVWVAQGTYLPSYDGDRDASFRIPKGVQLYGGFAGDETNLEMRNWPSNYTILSGEIGDPNNPEDNSYTVVYFEGANNKTVLDGFTIVNGYSDGTGEKGDVRRAGGGIFNNGSNGASNPTIKNCTFRGNFGRDGAAIYNYAANGETSASIINCSFAFNKADLEGGAIYNDGTNGICNTLIQGCTFLNNEASYGAGIHNQAENGETKPMIVDCNFSGNVSYIKGSSVYNYQTGSGVCAPVINGCDFAENAQSLGNDIEAPMISAEKNSSKSEIRLGSGK